MAHGPRGGNLHVARPIRLSLLIDACRDAARYRRAGAPGAGAAHGSDRGWSAARASKSVPAERGGAGISWTSRGGARQGRPDHALGSDAVLVRRPLLGHWQRDLPGIGDSRRAVTHGVVRVGRARAPARAFAAPRRTVGGRFGVDRTDVEVHRVHAVHRLPRLALRLRSLQRAAVPLPVVGGGAVGAVGTRRCHVRRVATTRPAAEHRRAARRGPAHFRSRWWRFVLSVRARDRPAGLHGSRVSGPGSAGTRPHAPVVDRARGQGCSARRWWPRGRLSSSP